MPPHGFGANLSSPAAAIAISGVDMDEKVDSVVGESSGRVMKSERIPEPHARRPRASLAAPTTVAGPSMKSLHLEKVAISGGELLHKEMEPEADVDKQRLRWEAVDEERQVWDAMDEQHKFKKKEEKMQKKEERRQKQDKERKRKLDVEVRTKDLEERRKKSGGGSPLAKKLSQRVTRSPLASLPLVSSPGVNMLKSGLGILASVATLKRRRSLSERDESSPSQKKAKSAVRSPSMVRSPSTSRSPSPTTSLLGGSKRIHSHGRKIHRLTSAVWRDFNPRYDDGKLVEGGCKHCNEVFPAGRDVGTSGVQRHLATCKIRSDLNLIVQKLKSSVSSPHASVLKNWEFDLKLSRQLLARMIVLDETPFSIVEYSGFVDFVKSLNPLFKMVSRNTIKDDCMKLYNKKRSAYCEGFKNYAGRVSLTSDMWTSNPTLGYICITIHFIDVNWKLHKKIIRFCMLEAPHNGVAMFNILLKSLQEWNLEDKLFSITVDNASVNGTMIDNLRENVVSKNMLLYEGELIHVRCACHVFNLIIQVGLLALKHAIDNVRESVKYIKSS